MIYEWWLVKKFIVVTTCIMSDIVKSCNFVPRIYKLYKETKDIYTKSHQISTSVDLILSRFNQSEIFNKSVF